VEVNINLSNSPGVINSSPYKEGWMIKVKPSYAAKVTLLWQLRDYRLEGGQGCCKRVNFIMAAKGFGALCECLLNDA